jgi:hypothetical protein
VKVRWLLVPIAAMAAAHAHATGSHFPSPCSQTAYFGYEPGFASSLDDVAPEARVRLLAYLDARLGADVAATLKLSGGQIVDRERLRRDVPDSVNYRWRIPKYALCFVLPIPGQPEGIGASVSLDEDGSIVKDIELPNFVAHPERRDVMTAVAARAYARTHGVPEDARAELRYVPASDTLEWLFTFVRSRDGLSTRYARLHIPAHDSQRLYWSESTAIR